MYLGDFHLSPATTRDVNFNGADRRGFAGYANVKLALVCGLLGIAQMRSGAACRQRVWVLRLHVAGA